MEKNRQSTGTNQRALAVLRPFSVYVDDDNWGELFKKNTMIRLAGGVELIELSRDGSMVRAVINDVHYPEITVRFPLSNLVTEVKPNTGRNTGSVIKACRHRELDMGCLSCWSKHWRGKAADAGIELPSVIYR